MKYLLSTIALVAFAIYADAGPCSNGSCNVGSRVVSRASSVVQRVRERPKLFKVFRRGCR